MADPNNPFGTPAMSRPALPPPVTVQQKEEAKREQTFAPIKGLLVSAAAVVPALTVMRSEGIFPGAARKLSSIGGGVGFGRGPAPYRPHFGPLQFATFLAPAPIGIVPPELMSIQPSFLNDTIAGRLPGKETLGIKASSAREAVFESERAEREISRAVLQGWSLKPDFAKLRAFSTADLIAMKNFLNTTTRTQFRSDAARNAIIDELAGRTGLALPPYVPDAPGIPSAISGPPVEGLPPGTLLPDGSFMPQLVVNANSKALANEDAAEGIRRELISERADP